MGGVWIIAAAMPPEAGLISQRLAPAVPLGRRPCWRGLLGDKEAVLMLTGLGMVNAAQTTAAALEGLAQVQGVINLGCAGAYPGSGLAKGQAAVADGMVLADQGVLKSGGPLGLEKIGIPLTQGPDGQECYNRLPVDEALSRELAAGGLARGGFATVGQVSGDLETAAGLALRWEVILEEMEGAAVAQVAAHYQVPFAAVRGISNQAGDRDLDVQAGAEAAQRAVLAWAGIKD